jgi:tRNA G10  N-methylase Trm11
MGIVTSIVYILGRQPVLGLAELESLYGSERVVPAGDLAAVASFEGEDPVPFSRIGGSIKAAVVKDSLPSTDWKDIERFLEGTAVGLSRSLPDGKIRLGISVYGFKMPAARINTLGLSLKKAIKKSGASIRVVPNKYPDLNSAQVLHNQLTGPTGIELVVVADGLKTIIARTTAVQDIEAYAARDQARPKRDAKVGMLPPKLAQIMLNLALVDRGMRVLDPFCGTGVVLQEAALIGATVYGTDIDERMVSYARDNLTWLQDTHGIRIDWLLETGDATSHAWQPPLETVVCETYLGRPLTVLPDPDTLHKIVGDCNTIITKSLENLARQTKTGSRVCIAVPAWQVRPNRFRHLPCLDHLQELGYNRIRFVHVETADLIYYRPDQVVARELAVLERI